jgi:hypothetical protein
MLTSDKHVLVRETFELTRDILFNSFKREFFDAPGAIQKYPDPAEREQRMRDYYNAQQEVTYPQYERMAMHDSVKGLTEHRDTMKRAIAMQGDDAWQLFTDEKELVRIEMRRAEREKPRNVYEQALAEAADRGHSGSREGHTR